MKYLSIVLHVLVAFFFCTLSVVVSSNLSLSQNWYASRWHLEALFSFTCTSLENSRSAVPARIALVVAFFECAEECIWLFRIANRKYGMQIAHLKFPFAIWMNWGNVSPWNDVSTSSPARLPTFIGGNFAARNARFEYLCTLPLKKDVCWLFRRRNLMGQWTHFLGMPGKTTVFQVDGMALNGPGVCGTSGICLLRSHLWETTHYNCCWPIYLSP